MSGAKLLSIVVPVYNNEAWLGKCLDSLLGPDPCLYEVIIIDDASKDSSLALAKQYAGKQSHFRIVEMGVNSGLCAVRNTGIVQACGEYVMFVDSDDYLSTCAVEEILSMLQTADADIVRFRLKRVSVSGETIVVQ
jgi:glycosyltransferase involved in cell wall biosynthesis